MTDSHDPSRREFLAMSAIGLIGLARGSESRMMHHEGEADSDLLYVGTYTENGRTDGVYLVSMNRRSGELRLSRSMDVGANPSFLAVHPNRRVLYVVNETEQYNGRPAGAVSAFAIADTGMLTRLSEVTSEGGSPCYVSVDRSGRVVLVANYAR
jgi:6-phosphogluconolactonase